MSVRAKKRAMADARAMDHEENRENVLEGNGATPSMGLSQVRGGSFHAVGGSRTGRYEGQGKLSRSRESKGGELHGGFLPLLAGLLTPLLGNMVKNLVSGKNVITGNGRYKKHVEEGLEGMGLHGGFLPALLGLLTPLLGDMVKNLVSGKNVITGNGKMKPPKGYKGAWKGLSKPESESDEESGAGFFSDMKEMGKTAIDAMPEISRIIHKPSFAEDFKRLTAKGHTGAGHCGAGKSDGRSKRASIVKKVMAEKGLSMINASKYVKEHNLYHP